MATVNLGRVGLVLRGNWVSTEDYVPLDLVSHDGNAWAAKRNNTNVEPTTGNDDDWQLISDNADLVATVQGYKEDAAASAASAAEDAVKGTEAQAMISPAEATSTASRPHPVGSYFIYNGEWYIATDNIAQGDTITPGTNCAVRNIGGEISKSNKSIQSIPERDLMMPNAYPANRTVSGVTFTWNAAGTECTVNGTNTSESNAANYFYGSATSLPEGIIPGESYHVTVSLEDDNVRFGMYYYVGGQYSSYVRITGNSDLTIPAEVTGILGLIYVPAGATVENKKVSNFGLFKKIAVDIGEYTSSVTELNNKDAALENEISTINSKIRLVPGLDLLIPSNRYNTTASGVTFTWNEDKTACTVNGTNTGGTSAGVYLLGGATTIPNGIVPGKTYHAKVSTTDSNLQLRFLFYKEGTYQSTISCTQDTVVTFPSDATGVYVAILISPGVSVENAVISDLALYESVDSMIAHVLSQFVADTALTVNDFRIINNNLYRITSPIASGAAITPGTNAAKTTVCAILKSILNA